MMTKVNFWGLRYIFGSQIPATACFGANSYNIESKEVYFECFLEIHNRQLFVPSSILKPQIMLYTRRNLLFHWK